MKQDKYIWEDGQLRAASFIEWVIFFELCERRVAATYLTPKTFVSTVFLGLDHSFDDRKQPLLFETMIFAKRFKDINQDMLRCTTLAEAKRQHEIMRHRLGFICANVAGHELINYLWPQDVDSEPTLLMVKAVLEAE